MAQELLFYKSLKIISVKVVAGHTLDWNWNNPMQVIETDKGRFIDNMPGCLFGHFEEAEPGYEWKNHIGKMVYSVKILSSRGHKREWLNKQSSNLIQGIFKNICPFCGELNDEKNIFCTNCEHCFNADALIKFLTESPLDTLSSDFKRKSFFYFARNNIDDKVYFKIFKSLLETGIDVDARNEDKYTSLLFAAKKGYTKCAEFLIENGADINARTPKNNTPLTLAAQRNKIDMVDLLIAKGADLNARTDKGNTALLLAMRENNYQIVLTLIENGADVNIQNDNGQTALWFTAKNNNLDMAETLLKNGAKADAFLKQFASEEFISLLQQYKAME